MAKRDVLDDQMARRFAWRTATPEGWPEADEAPPAPPPPVAEEQMGAAERERWERGRRECDELTMQVERVWGMTPASRQAAATATLIERAHRLGLHLFGMRHHPLACVRLWRLVVRHHRRLPANGRRFRLHALGFAAPPPEEREVADLLVEVAETGDEELAFLMERGPAGEAAGRRHPELGARLARVLEESKTWAAREIAARWLSFAELRDALPALRRALRRPHARIRWCALAILLERAPEALAPEDVQWLLEDAVKHPLPPATGTRSHETADGYADALLEAAAAVRPAAGWRPLEIIADDGGVCIRKEREGVDAGWALRALAAGYPERALTRIDRCLADTWLHRQRDAVEAAGRLPDALARPRLLEAATHPRSDIAERARAIWFKRFGGECPVDPLAGLPVHLLAEPAGERLLSRLTVLRGSSDDAKAAMVEALLAEAPPEPAEGADPEERALGAPQREALALLLLALRAGGRAYRRPGLPDTEEKWTALLLRRFGAPAFEGIAELAAADARAGVDHAWLGALVSLAHGGALRPAWRDRLRDIAAEGLRSPGWAGATAPLTALARVGAPVELLDLLWSIALEARDGDAPRKKRFYAATWAADALVAMPATPLLDARVAAEAAEALGARSWERFQTILRIGCRRRLPAALDLAERLLARIDDEPEAAPAIAAYLGDLRASGRIDDAWVLAALGQPETIRFDFAVRFAGKAPSLGVLSALQRALASPARGGAAAAAAAQCLVWVKALGPEDRRLDGILERAPAGPRASLLGALMFLDAPLSPFRRHYVDLLAGPDAEAAALAFEELYSNQPEGTWELFQAVLPLGPTAPVREAIEHYLGEPSEAELYWRHSDDDEEEDDELEDEFG